jgi:hypothetical protein
MDAQLGQALELIAAGAQPQLNRRAHELRRTGGRLPRQPVPPRGPLEAGDLLESNQARQLGMHLVKDTPMPRNGPPVRFRRTWCH